MDYKIPLILQKYDEISSHEDYPFKLKKYTDEELEAIDIKDLPKYDQTQFKDYSKVIADMKCVLKKQNELNDKMSQRKLTTRSKRQLNVPKVFEFKKPDSNTRLITPTTGGQSENYETPIEIGSQFSIHNQKLQNVSQTDFRVQSKEKIISQDGNYFGDQDQFTSIYKDLDLEINELQQMSEQDESKYLMYYMEQAKEALNEIYKKVVQWSQKQLHNAQIISKEEMENIQRKEEIKKKLSEIVKDFEDDVKKQQWINNFIKTNIKENENSLKVIFPDESQDKEDNGGFTDESINLGKETREKIGQLQQKIPKQDKQLENFNTPQRRSFLYQMKQKEQAEYEQMIEQQFKQRRQDQQRVIDSLENDNQPILLRKSLLEQQMGGQVSNIKSIQRDDRDNYNVLDIRDQMKGNDIRGHLERNQELQDLINREEQLLLLLKDLTGILIEYDNETRQYTLRSKNDNSKYMTYQAEADFKHILLITNSSRQRIPCTSHQKVKELICSYFCKQ